jgi:diguanylate cyclase (GGDEF)-like protein
MRLRLETRSPAPRTLAVRAMGAFGVAGGVLAGATAVLPPAASGSDAAIIAVGAASGLAGAWLLLSRPKVPEPGLGALTLLGTALITISTHEGGPTGGSGDNEMLYLWIALYSFYFFGLPHALAQLAVVGGAYAWLIRDAGPTDQAMTQWIVTMSTLLVAGVLIASLRSHLYGLIEGLSERASRDELTGLLNRGSLQDRFTIEHARARREDTSLSLLAMDVDAFKSLNDKLGHPTGDRVLREVGAILRGRVRETDSPARVGGDEFAVLLPGAGGPAAMLVAKDLRAAIARSPTISEVGASVSVGVSTCERGNCDYSELWQAADAAMYEAKRDGGDAVRFLAPGEKPLSSVETPLRALAHP